MKKRTRQILDNCHEHQCYACDGQGIVPEPNAKKLLAIFGQYKLIVCDTCKGTGVWVEEHYHLITTDEKGNKICFDVDNVGK